jgi:hypothetical protein
MASDNLIHWHAKAKVLKYSAAQVALSRDLLGREPFGADLAVHHDAPADGITYSDGNLLTTAGLARISSLIVGAGGQAAANGSCGLAVGTASTAATVADVALGTALYAQTADAGFPSFSNGIITIQATFGTAVGNGAWAEWGWVDAASFASGSGVVSTLGTSPVLINHKITSLGTKVSGSSWVFVATVTLV